jgi:hypothetical protein
MFESAVMKHSIYAYSLVNVSMAEGFFHLNLVTFGDPVGEEKKFPKAKWRPS